MFATGLPPFLMVEKPDRYRVGEHPRDAVEREWEVFVRADEAESLCHVGSLSAPSADVAYERATRLFAWYATDIWLCPARDVHRYSTRTLDEQAEPVVLDSGTEERTREV